MLMALQPKLLKDDTKLEACAVSDPAHVVLGAVGEQSARFTSHSQHWTGRWSTPARLSAKRYGASTAAALLAYKKKRKINNPPSVSEAGGQHRRGNDH